MPRPRTLKHKALVRVTRVADGFSVEGIVGTGNNGRPEPTLIVHTRKNEKATSFRPAIVHVDPAQFTDRGHRWTEKPVVITNGRIVIAERLIDEGEWKVEVLPDPTPPRIEPTEDDVMDALLSADAGRTLDASDIAERIASAYGRGTNYHADPWRDVEGAGWQGDTSSTRRESHIQAAKVKAVLAELIDADRVVQIIPKKEWSGARQTPRYRAREIDDAVSEAKARKERNLVRSRIHTEALDVIREKYRAEFDALVAKACEQAGIDPAPEDYEERLIRGY